MVLDEPLRNKSKTALSPFTIRSSGHPSFLAVNLIDKLDWLPGPKVPPIGHGFEALWSRHVKGTKYEVKQAQTAKCRDRTKTSWRYHHHQDHSVHYSFFLYKRHLSPRPSDLSQIARQKGAPQKLVGRNYFQAPQEKFGLRNYFLWRQSLVWEIIFCGSRI